MRVRWIVFLLLLSYVIAGELFLGFNRLPTQILATLAAAAFFEMGLAYLVHRKIFFPLSALTTACGLCLLLDYSHSHTLLLIPVFAAIASKYVFQFQGRHVFNPAQFGVVFSLLFTSGLISSAPAYQWYGISSMAFFLGGFAVILFMPQIDRWRLVVSFLVTFAIQTYLRAWIMRHHLPFDTLFWGTLSSPSFLLFTFYMITDPATSPKDHKLQWIIGALIATVDLVYHLFQSYYTFFFAGFTIAASRFLWSHFQALRKEGFHNYLGRLEGYRRGAVIVLIGAVLVGAVALPNRDFSIGPELLPRFERILGDKSGIAPRMGNLLERMDPRVQHISKWLLSIGDSVATGDVDGDGLQDLFFTFSLKDDADRCALYLNRGDFRFERVAIPAIEAICRTPEKTGYPSYALFQDLDGDRKPELLIVMAFGSSRLFHNRSQGAGVSYVDVSETAGLTQYRNSLGANFLDYDGDGRLDLFLANTLPPVLADYEEPRPRLNLFSLPAPAYEGDRRMFHFMHRSWNRADNGGLNEIYRSRAPLRFEAPRSEELGLTDTHWSLAASSADFDGDGFPDLYVANDFGPDELLMNRGGQRFEKVMGPHFGSISRDTYKGMNVSIGDIDRNGSPDVYVSNVHHALQAEGSLLWMTERRADGGVDWRERAGSLGVLNEKRFGWGAAIGDLNDDGWPDIVQANGMVDDSVDRRYEKCPDYWYVNEKIARSPPSTHAYADRWGDLRGMCIHGRERNRVYIQRGPQARPVFVDASVASGVGEETNARGVSMVDLDNDGKLDLVLTRMFAEPLVYRNLGTEKAHGRFVTIDLRGNGTDCDFDAIGSVVKIAGTPISSYRTSSTGFDGQSDPRVHLGLGAWPNPTVDVEVNWCGRNRSVEVFRGVSVDSFVTLEQGGAVKPR